jgi:hypothetical protein
MALVGPPGSGKTYTGLMVGIELARREGKRLAAVDTEHGSMSKYADLFDFDVIELQSYSPENFLDALQAAEQSGEHAVFFCDSLSHFWTGKDGALEFVDTANKRQRDQMGGWKDWRPHERRMIDAMIASPLHIVTTMRTKNEYQTVDIGNGKTKRVKIGLAPVQREGLEYEFDLVGTMDDDNTFVVDKTRCSFYARKALATPRVEDFEPFFEWLKGEDAPAPEQQGAPLAGATAQPVETPKPAAAAEKPQPETEQAPAEDDFRATEAKRIAGLTADAVKKLLSDLEEEARVDGLYPIYEAMVTERGWPTKLNEARQLALDLICEFRAAREAAAPAEPEDALGITPEDADAAGDGEAERQEVAA